MSLRRDTSDPTRLELRNESTTYCMPEGGEALSFHYTGQVLN